jgi:hypothetical protein
MGRGETKNGLIIVLAWAGLFVIGNIFGQDITEWAQPEGVSYWKGLRDHWLREIRQHVLSDLQPREMQIVNSIRFTDTTELRFAKLPEATKVRNQRIVYFPTDFLLRYEATNACNYVERELEVPYFTLKFAKYCQSTLEKASLTGENIPLKTPFDFAELSTEQRRAYYETRERRKICHACLALACGFVIAHEVAHHIQGDLDRPRGDQKARARAEIAADNWACNLLSAKGGTAYAGSTVLDFEFGLSSQASSKRDSQDLLVTQRLLNILIHITEMDEEQLRLSAIATGVDYKQLRKKLRYEIKMVRQHLEED